MTYQNKQIMLGVNIDHVATLRQARGGREPDPVFAAMLAESAGADGITVHLREDRRHIQERDMLLLKEVIKTHINFEMAATKEMVAFAQALQPKYCCLVPEKRQELTTEGGLDVFNQMTLIHETCAELQALGIQISLFIDADLKQIDAAKEVGANIIEIHTGKYAESTTQRSLELKKIQQAAKHASQLGLQVNAGHGLNYQNVQPIAAIPEMVELNIGHSIVAHAVLVGFAQAVKQMKELMVAARL